MRVVSKTDAADHVFSALPKEEMESIGQFLKSKNVRLKNELDDVMDIDPISDDDDDEDMSIPSEDEQKGKKGKSAGPAASKRDEEEDESGELIAGEFQSRANLRRGRRFPRGIV